MTRDERREITHRQFLFYIKCLSLRKTANFFDTDNQLLSYRFRKYLHPQYVKLSRQGICGEMGRYLLSPKYSDRKKQEIEQWLITNIEHILETDFKKGVDFHTESKANKLAKQDLRYIEDYAY